MGRACARGSGPAATCLSSRAQLETSDGETLQSGSMADDYSRIGSFGQETPSLPEPIPNAFPIQRFNRTRSSGERWHSNVAGSAADSTHPAHGSWGC